MGYFPGLVVIVIVLLCCFCSQDSLLFAAGNRVGVSAVGVADSIAADQITAASAETAAVAVADSATVDSVETAADSAVSAVRAQVVFRDAAGVRDMLDTPSVGALEGSVSGHSTSAIAGTTDPTGVVTGLTAPAAPAGSDDLLDFSDLASGTSYPEMDPIAGTARILASLGVVIALILGISWFLQKRGGFTRQQLGHIHGVIPLDSKRFVYVVEVLGKVMVLGVTEQSINHLSDVTEPDALARLPITRTQSATAPALAGMFDFLKKKYPDQNTDLAATTEESVRESTDRTRVKLQRIRELLVERGKDTIPKA